MSFKLIAIAETDISDLYPFQNETRISNRDGSIFRICDHSYLESPRSGFHFGMDILTFGGFSLLAMAQEIFKETAQITGIHGSSAQIVSAPAPDKKEIRDLDLLIMAESISPETCKKLQEIIHTHTQTPSFELKNENGTSIGFQAKGSRLGGADMPFSLTVYTKIPTDPIYDDIAHSEIFWITPHQHTTAKFPDLPFIQYLKEQKIIFTPHTHTPKKQIFRVAMRETKGWHVHTSEMDKRVYESGAKYWESPYLIGKGINEIWIEHFGYKNKEAYPRLVFFMLSRLIRHNQDPAVVSPLWQCISPTLDSITHPQKVTTMTALASYLQSENPDTCDFHSYLLPFRNRQADCISLCDAWSACQRPESKALLIEDLKPTLVQIARNTCNKHDECLITAEETPWQATIKHLGYTNSVASALRDTLFLRVILPTLPHLTRFEQEQFIHDQLSGQFVSTTQYTGYISHYPEALETWLRNACDTTPRTPNKAIHDTACKLIDLGAVFSDTTKERLLQHLASYIKLAPKPDGYYQLWTHLLQTTPLIPSVLETIETTLTPRKNWGYPDDALLAPTIEKLMHALPTNRPWPLRLEILAITHIPESAFSEKNKKKLAGYIKNLFSNPNWHQGFGLKESLDYIRKFFTHRPKLQDQLTETLLDSKDPINIEDATAALAQWTTASRCPQSQVWLNSAAYLITRNVLPQPEVLDKLWAMAITTTWHTGFSQKPLILSTVIDHQVRKDPGLIPQIPAFHRQFENLALDEATQIYILDHATDATLIQCMDIYIWDTKHLPTTLFDYRNRFINDTKRHTPVVQTALREEARRQQTIDIALSLSIWINLPNSEEAILSSIETAPRMPATSSEIYSVAVSKIVKSNSPAIKTRFQTILDSLNFDKIDSKLHAQLLAGMRASQLHKFLEHNPKRISTLSTDKQKSLLESVVYEDHPHLIIALIEHLSPAPILSVIENTLSASNSDEKPLYVIETALIQRKIKRPALNNLFEKYFSSTEAPAAAKYPQVCRSWTQYQQDKAAQISNQKQEEDAAIHRKSLRYAESTMNKATSAHMKNKDIDTGSLATLKTLFSDSTPAQQQQLMRDCPSLETLPFYLQDIALSQMMSTLVGKKCILTPPAAVDIAIKADNVEFMTHLHNQGLSLYFSCTDHATNIPRTLLDFAIHYKRPNYYRYLFNAMYTEIQEQEQSRGTLVCAAICGKLENLKFLLQHGHYDKSPSACEKRIQHTFTLFCKLGTANFQWNPAHMMAKERIIEGLTLLIQEGYITLSTPIAIAPEATPQSPISIALGVEAQYPPITTNGLSYLLIQAGESRPSNAQLGALFLAYAIHQNDRNYSANLEIKIRQHLNQGFRLTPDEFKGLFKLFPDFISSTQLLPLLKIILKHQKDVLLANQNEHNPFAAIILASPSDHTPVRLLLDSGLSPNERSHKFHLSHLLLRYATADMFAFLVANGMSISESISTTDIIPTFPPISLTTREYLCFVTPKREQLHDFQRKNNLLKSKGIGLSPEKIMRLKVFDTAQNEYMAQRKS